LGTNGRNDWGQTGRQADEKFTDHYIVDHPKQKCYNENIKTSKQPFMRNNY